MTGVLTTRRPIHCGPMDDAVPAGLSDPRPSRPLHGEPADHSMDRLERVVAVVTLGAALALGLIQH